MSDREMNFEEYKEEYLKRCKKLSRIQMILHDKLEFLDDGYHTFDELYYHRMILFSIICNQNRRFAWKSKLHNDGTMYDNYFIAGIETKQGQYTYHYDMKYYDYFEVKELDKAPEWDGHTPKDINRLLSLL